MSSNDRPNKLDTPGDEDIWITGGSEIQRKDPLHIGLRDLEVTIRCRICHDFYHAPVSIMPCHHTYCSECIRNHFKAGLKSMKRTASCPECRTPVDPKGAVEFSKCLIPNRSIEIVTLQFKQIRSSLHNVVVKNKKSTSPRSPLPASYSNARNNSDDENDEYKNDTVGQGRIVRGGSSREQIPSLDALNEYERPTKRRTVLYKSLKRKQLQDLCEQDGLSTNGSDKDLIQRHEAFVTLYNSECDSLRPRPVDEIVREIWEREFSRSSSDTDYITAACMERLKERRKQIGENDTSIAKLSSGNKAFDIKLNDNFAKLIAQAKAQKMRQQQQRQNDDDPSKIQSETKDNKESESVTETCTEPSNQNEIAFSSTRSTASSHFKDIVHDKAKSQPESVRADHGISTKYESTGVEMTVNENHSSDAKCDSPNSKKRKSPDSYHKTLKATDGDCNTHNESPNLCENENNSIRTNLASNRMSYTIDAPLRKNTTSNLNFSGSYDHREKYVRRNVDADGKSLIGPWACAVCTFWNQKNRSSRAVCEMCASPRPNPSKESTRMSTPNSEPPTIYSIDN